MLNLKHFKKLYFSLLLLFTIIIIGVTGFVQLEGYTILEALYMTIITMSTVGFREVHELSSSGKIFTILLIVVSFGTFAYSISSITLYVLDGEFRRYFKDLSITKKVNKISNHIIICGYGRNGKQAVSELTMHKKPFILIEQDSKIIEELRTEAKISFIQGDATHEKTLEKAGISRAKALITTLPKDADNMFVVLTAREMNPDLLIISRASEENSDKKLRRAGADNVIMPDKIGGAHMASLVIKPDVIEFMDYVMGQGNNAANLEEITFENLPKEFQNKSIKDLGIRNKSGANIVGFRTPEGEYIINPSPDQVILSGTKIFVLGTENQISAFREISTQKDLLKEK